MKTTKLTLLISTLLLAASTQANAANDWKDTAHDAWIDGKAESTLLFNTHLNAFKIDTDVKDGVITLTGTVENEVDKALAGELMASLDGVSDVENDLKIEGEKPSDTAKALQAMKDAKVETVVKARLLMESEVGGTDVEVEVTEGVVTLTGKVSSDAERQLAVTIAKNANDVKDVKDELKVKS